MSLIIIYIVKITYIIKIIICLKRFLSFLFLKFCYFREESHSMLGYHSTDHAKAIRFENVCEDIENNNIQDKNQNFEDEHDVIHYSSNSKGIFAQVRVRKPYR